MRTISASPHLQFPSLSSFCNVGTDQLEFGELANIIGVSVASHNSACLAQKYLEPYIHCLYSIIGTIISWRLRSNKIINCKRLLYSDREMRNKLCRKAYQLPAHISPPCCTALTIMSSTICSANALILLRSRTRPKSVSLLASGRT